jgi:hypothetical protein
VNGVVACLFFGAPFCVVFYGVGRPNCYVPLHHVPSIIQTTVPAMPDLSFVLCVLIGDDDPEGSNPRDIRVRARGGGLWRISDAHCAYDPLHFVLFHPHGKPGWHPNITSATSTTPGVHCRLHIRLLLIFRWLLLLILRA